MLGPEVLRSIASSLLSLLIVTTSMWGGCISCEQYFMFPGAHRSCCNKSGQCERPGRSPSRPEKRDCNRLPFDRGGNSHTLPHPAVLPSIAGPLMDHDCTLVQVRAFESRIDPSPPDVQAVNATFLI
jgi:hypothetical protein